MEYISLIGWKCSVQMIGNILCVKNNRLVWFYLRWKRDALCIMHYALCIMHAYATVIFALVHLSTATSCIDHILHTHLHFQHPFPLSFFLSFFICFFLLLGYVGTGSSYINYGNISEVSHYITLHYIKLYWHTKIGVLSKWRGRGKNEPLSPPTKSCLALSLVLRCGRAYSFRTRTTLDYDMYDT